MTPASDTPRVAVILRHGQSAESWSARYRDGRTWDETAYGYHLAGSVTRMRWSRDYGENRTQNAMRRATRRVLGFDLVHAWRNRALLRWADVVLTHTEREHLAVATVGLLTRTRPPVRVAQSVWLWDTWDSLGPLTRRVYARLLRWFTLEVVLSPANRAAADRSVPGRTVVFVPFGTHGIPASDPGSGAGAGTGAGTRAGQGTATPTRTDRPRVLTVGNDRHRDWDLLLQVARQLPEIDFAIATLNDDVRSLPWPENVEVSAAPSTEALRAAYLASDAVALPLQANLHASGCTVAIEALSARRPLIVTRTGGIEAYTADSGAHLVEVGDVSGFTEAVRAALGDPESHRPPAHYPADHGLTQRDYIVRLLRLSTAGLQGSTPPTDVSDTVPQEWP